MSNCVSREDGEGWKGKEKRMGIDEGKEKEGREGGKGTP